VVVTTYNRPSELGRVLGALLIQSKLPHEVIVADDGSGPETGELLREFASGAPFPVVHSWQDDKGFRAARSRNLAVRKSTGDYIIFLDGDCVVERTFIEDHLRLAERGCFVQGKRVLVSRKASEGFGPELANSRGRLLLLALSGRISNSHHIMRLPAFPASRGSSMRGIKTCNMGVFREDLFAVNGFDEAFEGWGREDSEFASRLYRLGLMRKDHPFMAVCFHLWHAEVARGSLERNDEMLAKALESGLLRCEQGIGDDPLSGGR
jgi:glycosyltransferase involved in cell wall biosynthesis